MKRKKSKNTYEVQRIKRVKKERAEQEASAQFIAHWHDLDEIPKESETHTLEVCTDKCCGYLHPKDPDGEFHYLSTHTFYGGTHAHSTRILRECGFNVTINNWDSPENKDKN